MHSNATRWLLALLAAIFLSLPLAFTQSVVSGDITGTLVDPSGALIHAATNVDDGASQTTSTNTTGLYRFNFMKPGPYKLTMVAKGFKTVEQKTAVAVG